MPPHTTLQYTMPASTPATTSAAAKSSSSSTSAPAAASSKPRQRRATTSASSFIFAPSWLTNHKDKAGSSAAGSAATASASTAPSPSYQSASESPGSSKSVATNTKEKENNRRRDSSPSLKAFPRTSSPPRKELTSSRFPSTSDSLAEKETTAKSLHSRSHSSQASSGLSFSPSNFDRNFPTLARKKAATLSVDLPPRSVENIWASSDAKSRVLSPTTPTPITDEDRLEKQIEEQEHIERLKSLVPKVDSSKFDGKRNAKRKPSRSLSMDSPGSPVATPLFGSRGRTLSQSQQTRAVSKTGTSSPTRPRATSAAGSNGVKKNQIGSSRTAGFSISSKKTGSGASNGGFSKYSSAWSNPNKMGRVGIHHKMYDEVKDALSLDYDQIDEEDEDDYDVDPAQDLFSPFDQQHRLVRPSKDATAALYTAPRINGSSSRFDLGAFAAQQGKSRLGAVPIAVTRRSPSPVQNDANEQRLSRALELEERFLSELGWQKPADEDADSDKWTITDEERRSFVNLVCALNGFSIGSMGERGDEGDEFRPTREDIERAGIQWTARKRRQQQRQQQQYHGLAAFGRLSDAADEELDVNAGGRDGADGGVSAA